MARRKDPDVIVSGKGPILSLVMGLAFSAAIAYNALGRQEMRHPAPFEGFWALGMNDTEEARPLLRRSEVKKTPVVAQADMLIKELQVGLAALGYYDGPVDGLNGRQTAAAIKRYAQDHKLGDDTRPTAALLDHIKLNQRIRDAVSQPPPAKAPAKSAAVQEGAAEKKVRTVQTGLSELGYTPGPIDGVVGQQTVDAIKSFEADRRMKITGEISDRLIRELRSTTGLSSLNTDNNNG